MKEKKRQLRQLLAEKEVRGISGATKKCENPAVKGSFRCDLHEKTVDSIAKAIQEKSEEGRLLASSIQTPDEFAFLQRRKSPPPAREPGILSTISRYPHTSWPVSSFGSPRGSSRGPGERRLALPGFACLWRLASRGLILRWLQKQ